MLFVLLQRRPRRRPIPDPLVRARQLKPGIGIPWIDLDRSPQGRQRCLCFPTVQLERNGTLKLFRLPHPKMGDLL